MAGELDIILIFCLIILAANIIQGITGFAGTLIAMPFLIMLIDIETARQVLNLLGILGSLWILSKDYRYIEWKQLKKILLIMPIGLIIGVIGFNHFPRDLLLFLLPLFVLFVGIKGFVKNFISKKQSVKKQSLFIDTFLLLMAGVIHGLFVAGGPLLVAYTTKHVKGKHEFRATLSVVWVILNTIIFVQSLMTGMITTSMSRLMLLAMIPLLLGIAIGGILIRQMSQKMFMLLAYFLLIFSGISMLL